jgi:hypothetical protein
VRLTDDKINYLSHVVVRSLSDCPEVDFRVEDNQVRLTIKEALTESIRVFEQLEEKVAGDISSRSRKIVEGSGEWEVEYRRIYEDEINKLKAV